MMRVVQYAAVTAAVFASLFWLAQVFGLSLRDPRFFDGWILFAAMAGQLLFHLRDKIPFLPDWSDARWRQIHIVSGYAVLGVFLVHTRAGLPDSVLEWSMWVLFVAVVASGILGSYLMVVIPVKLEQHAAQFEFETLSQRRLQLARRAEVLATSAEESESLRAIWELYSKSLRDFFNGPRNVLAHVQGSKLPLRRLNHQIDASELAVDSRDKKTLRSLKALVAEKDRLDFCFAHEAILRAWSFLHVPATYGLGVLIITHVAITYAFSLGVP